MLKAVLDTNVVVSAHLTADGPAALILRLALSRYFQYYVSEEILEEYCEVLQRRKFKLDGDYVVQSLERVSRGSGLGKSSLSNRCRKRSRRR
jgi:uncharacterized protein